MLNSSLTYKRDTQKILRPTPWYDRYQNHNDNHSVAVIGGGISGAATCYSLLRRGYKVTLFERHSELGMEASGNPQGILYGNFFGTNSANVELSIAGYKYSYDLIHQILTRYEDFDTCGMVQFAYNDKILKQQQGLLKSALYRNTLSDFCHYVDKTKMAQLTNINESNIPYEHGLYFSNGTWISPQIFIDKLTKHPSITIKCDTEIISLRENGMYNWELVDQQNNMYNFPNVVICNANDAIKFTQISNLYLRKIRGQVSIISNTPHEKLSPTNMILCNSGYITPPHNNSFTIGATFNFKDFDEKIRDIDHIENINHFKNLLPNILNNINPRDIMGRVGFRCSTTDYFPMVGPIADYRAFKEIYKNLQKDSNYWIDDDCPYLHGLYLNIGHGAKGILTAPICGEVIADYIDNTDMALNKHVIQKIHPNRFWRDEIVRREISYNMPLS